MLYYDVSHLWFTKNKPKEIYPSWELVELFILDYHKAAFKTFGENVRILNKYGINVYAVNQATGKLLEIRDIVSTSVVALAFDDPLYETIFALKYS